MNVRVVALIGAASITAVGTAACNRYTTLPPGSPTPVDQNAIVAGTVWLQDTGGVKPDANVQLSVWVQTGNTGRLLAPTNAGPDGRYSLTVPTGASLRVLAGWFRDVPPRYQPCVTTTIAATGNTNLDVHTIADPAQLGAHLPSELLASTPTLSGRVFETTALGRQPVPGVLLEVDLLAGLGDVSATTLTDADGGYVLCGLGAGSPYVWALKSGYQTAEVGTVIVNGNTIRDIELQR